MLYPLTVFVRTVSEHRGMYHGGWEISCMLYNEGQLRAWLHGIVRVYPRLLEYRIMDAMQDDVNDVFAWQIAGIKRAKLMPLPQPEFRSGPIPLKRRAFRAYYRAHYRRVRTQPEIRARADFDQVCMDTRMDYGIDIRGRRRPRLPNIWDDCPRSASQRSWKKHRRTQYR